MITNKKQQQCRIAYSVSEHKWSSAWCSTFTGTLNQPLFHRFQLHLHIIFKSFQFFFHLIFSWGIYYYYYYYYYGICMEFFARCGRCHALNAAHNVGFKTFYWVGPLYVQGPPTLSIGWARPPPGPPQDRRHCIYSHQMRGRRLTSDEAISSVVTYTNFKVYVNTFQILLLFLLIFWVFKRQILMQVFKYQPKF
jgi:hypothetical protein